MGGDDHRCEWREEVERLRADVAYAAQAVETAEATVAELQEQLRLKDEALASVQATVESCSAMCSGSAARRCLR